MSRSLAAPTPAPHKLSTVDFSDLPSRCGPLTLAQANVKRWLDASTDHFDWNQCVQLDLPPGVSMARVVDVVRQLVTRNESLRTIFPDHQEPAQHVLGNGAVPLLSYANDTDPARLAIELRQSTRFDLTTEMPLKVAVVSANGRPTQMLLLLSHIAADMIGVQLVQRSARRLFEGRPLPSAPQPVDVALAEHSEAWRRRVSRALRYWTTQLTAMPQAAFRSPAPEPADCYGIQLRSGAAAGALATVSDRTRTSPSTVLLSLLAALVGALCDQHRITIASVSANRTDNLKDYVGTLAQDALLIADLRCGTFDDFVGSMRPVAIRAYANSRFDAAALWRIIHEVEHRRGIRFTRDVVFNDRSWLPGDSPAPPVHTGGRAGVRIARLPAESLSTKCMLWVDSVHEELGVTLRADPNCLPEDEGVALVRGLTTLLFRAADGSVAMAEVPSITGLAPRGRGPGWHLVDSCWINLDAVRRLLNEVLRNVPHAVFVEHPATGPRLICNVVAENGTSTPAAIHERCMRLLPGRPDVMAPQSYRVYRRAPTDLDDASAWPGQALLFQDDGRCPAS
jgi:hypothetical protein